MSTMQDQMDHSEGKRFHFGSMGRWTPHALLGHDCGHMHAVQLPRWPMTKQEVAGLMPAKCWGCGGPMDRSFPDGPYAFGLDFNGGTVSP